MFRYRDIRPRNFGGFKQQILQQFLHDRVQPSGTDIIGFLVDFRRDDGHFPDGFLGEGDVDILRCQQRDVLLQHRIIRLGKDADEIIFREVVQFHPDRETPLQFGDQIAWLGNVERT